jgi:hypothetical protein
MKRMISLLLVASLVSGCGKQLNESQTELDKTYIQNDEQSAQLPSPSLPKSAILQMGLIITVTVLIMFTLIELCNKYSCCGFEKIEKEVSSSSSLSSLSDENQEEEAA